MNKDITQSYELSAGEAAQLKRLTAAPDIAWPTVLMLAAGLAVIIVTDILGVMGYWPLWLCAIINGLAGYLMFSAAHDAIHRAVSTNTRLNDWVGRLSLLPLSPMASLGLFRWGHIQHHRYAVDEKDPDRWSYEGPKWLLPMKWMLIDIWYFFYVIGSKDKVAYKHLRTTLKITAVSLSIIGGLIWAGYGMEVLMLWFVPSRIASLLLGFAFFWLPHEPHDVSQAEHFTRSSTIRVGYEWLMSPLLQYQNFHLIHHLHPRTPFYNNGKVWHLLENNLRKHELAIQQGFAIKPTLYFPASEASA
ncbi:MAG: fatty acid desaturase [Nevskiales bacterium]